jgi:hypothetical protein
MKDSLTNELTALSERAFELAVRVLDDPAERTALAPEAKTLRARLDELTAEIQTEGADAVRELRSTISETRLDLRYAQQNSSAVSLRLGREMVDRK